MCGRFTRKEELKHLAEQLRVILLSDLQASYNITPSQQVACVRVAPNNQHRECVLLRWGLIPSWSKDPSIGNKLGLARGETVAEKPAFRKAYRSRRCLVLADGYYEWKREGNVKVPYYIHLKGNQPFAFAGLWEHWEISPNNLIKSCAIITTASNKLMEPIHPRMPVILEQKQYDVWLNPKIQDVDTLNSFLRPYPESEMIGYPVSSVVNNPSNDSERCVVPL